MANNTLRPPYPQERDKVQVVQEAEWATGPVWTGTEMDTGSRSNHKQVFNFAHAGALPFKDEAQIAVFKDPVRTAL